MFQKMHKVMSKYFREDQVTRTLVCFEKLYEESFPGKKLNEIF